MDYYQNKQNDVYLSVYNITKLNKFLKYLGIAIYHTAVQVNNIEYNYGAHCGSFSGICALHI